MVGGGGPPSPRRWSLSPAASLAVVLTVFLSCWGLGVGSTPAMAVRGCGAHCGGVEAGELSYAPLLRPLAEDVTKFSWISDSGCNSPWPKG